MTVDNYFIDSRHAYLGYIDIRNFWFDYIDVIPVKPNIIFNAQFTSEEVYKVYYIVSQYLKCNYSTSNKLGESVQFPCTKFIPNGESKVYYNEDEVTLVKNLKQRLCVSGYATIRVYNPRKLCYDADSVAIAGISIVETHEQYYYKFGIQETLHEDVEM